MHDSKLFLVAKDAVVSMFGTAKPLLPERSIENRASILALPLPEVLNVRLRRDCSHARWIAARFVATIFCLTVFLARALGQGPIVSHTIQISNDADDGYYNEYDGSGWHADSQYGNGSADLVGSWSGTTEAWVAGYRFPSTGINSGDTIRTAYLELVSSDGAASSTTCGSAPCAASNSTFRVYGVAQDDGPSFSNTSGNTPISVPYTASYVDYTTTGPGDVHGSCQGNNNGQNTCTHIIDVTNIVKEITSRPGWTSSSAIRFVMLSTNGAAPNVYAGFEDYSANPAKAAMLVVNPPLPTIVSSGGWGTSPEVTYPTTFSVGPFVYPGASTLFMFLGDYYNFYGQAISQPTVTDNCGNTWNILAGPTNWAGQAYYMRATVYYVESPASCPDGDTITVNVPVEEPIFLHFLALAGSNAAQIPVATAITSPPSGTYLSSASTDSLTVTGVGQLLSWIFGDSDSAHTFTPQTGFATDVNSIPTYLTATSENISSPGSYQNTYTITPSADGWETLLVDVPAASGTAAAPTVTVSASPTTFSQSSPVTVTVTVSGSPTPTGSVVVTGGGYTSSSVTLTSGSATVDIPGGSLNIGTDNLSATYTPDSGSSSIYSSATGTTSVTVADLTPTVTVTPTPSSITTTQSLSVTVTLDGGTGNPTPTGAVTLSGGGYTSGATTLSGGSATINIAAGTLAVGSDMLTASYTPDSGSSSTYTAATGSNTVTVTETTPTVTVTPSPTSITTAQALTVMVNVSGTPTPTGSVTLTSGSYTSTATALSSGAASINVPAGSLAAGSDTLSVRYTPDSNSSSVYNSASGSNTVTVTEATPTVTVTPSSNSITTAQPLSVTVTVSAGLGSLTATGSVTLTGGSYTSAATTLSGGSATVNIPAGTLSAAGYTFKATYTPDSNSASIYTSATGTASASVTVGVATPTVTVTPSSNSIATTQPLTVTVTVAGSSTPTGSVTLSGGSYTSAATTLSGGTATINIPAGTLASGNYTFKATYTPDTNGSSYYSTASGTAASAVVVSVAAPTVTVTPSTTSITTIQPFSVTVTVSGGAGDPAATGSVVLTSGSYTSAATTLTGGTATINIAGGTLGAGSYTFKATYTPDTSSSSIYATASGTASSAVNVGVATPTVAVTPSSNSISAAQSLSVTVVVSGGTGNPTATGSVIVTGGSYTSAATTLTGGTATINIPAGTLSAGSYTFKATYTPDTNSSSVYSTASGTATAAVSVGVATPAVTVTPSPNSITTAQALTVTVAIAGTPTPTGSVILSSGSYTSAATTLNGGSATINVPAGSLAAGTDTLTANYTPDSSSASRYGGASGSNTVTVTTAVSPGFSISGASVTIAPGATTGNTSTITVTPSGGFTGSVTLSAAITSSPSGAQYPPNFSFGSSSPVSISGANAATATLTITTTAATSGAVEYPARPSGRWYATEGSALACLLFFCIPRRRRNWRAMVGMLVLLAFVVSGALACGGKATTSSNPGTTAGPYTITITGTSGSATAQGTVTLTVQ